MVPGVIDERSLRVTAISKFKKNELEDWLKEKQQLIDATTKDGGLEARWVAILTVSELGFCQGRLRH